MTKMKRKPKTEYQKKLDTYRQLSSRHVLVLEADMSEDDKRTLFHEAELIRKAGNELTGIMKKRYDQLIRTKHYRELKAAYGKAAEKGDDEARKACADEMAQMQKEYHVTWDYCRTAMIPIGKRYGIHSVFALTRAEDVWRGVEKCLYGDGRTLHFVRQGELPNIRAKQINRTITVKVKDESLYFSHRFREKQMTIRISSPDRFQTEETAAVMHYLEAPEAEDRKAVQTLSGERVCIDTFRPCYVSFICKTIRGKLRVYIHLTIEGHAKPKYNKDGTLRHTYGRGKIGSDIGTQTVAYTSDKEVGLKNLAERGSSILENERKERLIYRAMDGSRRAMNPDNYNENGTIRKGRKQWVESNHYKKLKTRHREMCRINAENRHYAIDEDVNHLRELGDVFITEPKNSKKLQKRAEKTTVNERTGKKNPKKRFGKSIKNRCPGYFQGKVQQKFESTGGIYKEVPFDYRASQYDHTVDDYIKKKLTERMFYLKNGPEVQRDWYSSFLLYCYDLPSQSLDKQMCKDEFGRLYQKEKELLAWIKDNKIKILNSGIKIA